MTTRAPDAKAPAAPRPPAGAVELDQRVSRAVDDLRESYWETQVAAAENKTVLLVEGDDDRDVLEAFLARRSATFQTRVRVVPAGGRERVLQRMKTSFPRAFALVDRDTWTDVERRYEADVTAEGSTILAGRMPVGTANTQGRAYFIKTKVPAKPEYQNFAREVLIRGDHRLMLVQVIHTGENVDAIEDEVAAVLKSITVY